MSLGDAPSFGALDEMPTHSPSSPSSLAGLTSPLLGGLNLLEALAVHLPFERTFSMVCKVCMTEQSKRPGKQAVYNPIFAFIVSMASRSLTFEE